MVLDTLKRIVSRWLGGRRTYAQCGEDVLADFILRQLGVSRPSYLDVGAYDGVELSNTYYFYRQGCRGVLVEPNPARCARLRRQRREDTIVAAAAGAEGSATLYVMDPATLTTLNETEALRMANMPAHRIVERVTVPVRTLTSIIECEFEGRTPELLSVDVEGLDLEVLRTLNWERYQPRLVIVETILYGSSIARGKPADVREFMESRGYSLVADTVINSLFIPAEQ